MRVFLVGDGHAFADEAMGFATTNQLLFLDAVRWLGGEESFSGAVSQEEDERIVHTKEQDQLWFYSTILGMPSLLLGLGLLVSRRRKGPGPRPTEEAPSGAVASQRDDEDEPKRRLKRPKKVEAKGEDDDEPQEEASDGASDDMEDDR